MIVLLSFAGTGVAPAQAASMKPGKLEPPTWSEEFDGDELDLGRWGYRKEGEQRHDGYLARDAVVVRDGALTIKTYTEGARHYSGMISTQKDGSKGFEQKYGYFEARVKFNDSPGGWSAFWLQSGTIGHPKGDPATAGVEMDIAEHRARCVSSRAAFVFACVPPADVSDRVQQGLVWDGYGADSQSLSRLSDPLDGLRNDTWHTFALSWTQTALTFYYDDSVIWSAPGPISQRSQYIVLSSEVGEFFAGAIPEGGYGSRSTSETQMKVDYVRVWDTPRAQATPASTTAPTVSGTPKVRARIACAGGAWTGTPAPSLSYRWLADGSPIAGASTATYVVRRADRGRALACRVTAANAAGSSSALSNALLIPAAPQKLGPVVRVTIACPRGVCSDRAIRATATATVRVPATRRTLASRYSAKAITTIRSGGRTVAARLHLPKSVRRTIRRALTIRKPVVVRFSIRLLDSSGSTGVLARQTGLRL